MNLPSIVVQCYLRVSKRGRINHDLNKLSKMFPKYVIDNFCSNIKDKLFPISRKKAFVGVLTFFSALQNKYLILLSTRSQDKTMNERMNDQ